MWSLGKIPHSPRTAKRYAQSPQKPEYTLTQPKPTKLDAYKQQINQWLEEAPYSAVRILEKLQEQGFDGKWKKLYCFLMILGYSRMRYIEFVTDMGTNTLIRCHQNAFRYFGGYPEEILYDNMKQVGIKRLLKQEDSTLNRQFGDFAGFYGCKPILCRPYRGQTKGKVERKV